MENKKEKYLKPECSIYEIELEGCILNTSNTKVDETDINDFLPGKDYDSSVF